MCVKPLNILHIGTSHKHDSPFILASEYLFEKAFPRQNIFFLISGGANDHIYTGDHFITGYNEANAQDKLIHMVSDFDVIVFHGLTRVHTNLALSSSLFEKIVWLFWGGEVYNNPKLNRDTLLGPATKQLLALNNFWTLKGVKYLIRKYIYPSSLHCDIAKVAPKIKYIGVPYEEDFVNLKAKTAVHPDCIPLIYSYYPPEHVFTNSEDFPVLGDNILLGNSATPENNHAEIFEVLRTIDIKPAKVVTILSYGDLEYRDKVIDQGLRMLAEDFMPITDFMPLENYNKLLNTCSVAIMNHYRQQAVGNILSLLWIGAKVFLSDRNTMYHFLKRIGCNIYSVDEIGVGKEALGRLTQAQILENRRILKDRLSTTRLSNNLKDFFSNFSYK
ncbi:TDP-N-acetylfucosamine:lipid II N-acetylfucosaminyltransferase [Paradesertivirga mongoliensis]|uniref:TDP-N-acetylfucosamine:lipid II N-acetylfucosaminyltransferase n=1 Tax=Paradesertivirga mongoliensis TaxID=2100740 RepID=A0ABW4ZIL2_9SPHI|nr:TDP-N-acetylfucosamine:lipid II N-acetylfucosaminyltransferase [Pedobacter mongoliensis]